MARATASCLSATSVRSLYRPVGEKRQMNWNAVGAIGQILGSLAVFVTIGFLAVQVHDNETR